MDRPTPRSIFVVHNTVIIKKTETVYIDLTLLPQWRLLIVLFRSHYHKPTIHHQYNFLKHVFIIRDHSWVVPSDFEAKLSLLYHEQFWNEFCTHLWTSCLQLKCLFGKLLAFYRQHIVYPIFHWLLILLRVTLVVASNILLDAPSIYMKVSRSRHPALICASSRIHPI